VSPREMDKRNDYDRWRDHCEPSGKRSRNSRDEIADAHNVKPDGPRRASGYDDSLVKLLLAQDAVLRYERAWITGSEARPAKAVQVPLSSSR
jgi:hypothetical protein